MAVTEQNKTKRDLLGERLKRKYPDREYADDEALFGQINDDYDDYDGRLGKYEERERALVDVFNRDPRSAQFLTDMANGRDPWLNLIRRVGVDGMTDILNDPAKQDEFQEANKEYLERLARSKALDEEYEKNLAASQETVAAIQAEKGVSDDVMDKALDLLGEIANEVILGKFTRENIEIALKAINYDADMETAAHEAEIRGRNAKVEAALRKPSKGDGVPMLGGSNNSPAGNKEEELDVFAQAALAR